MTLNADSQASASRRFGADDWIAIYQLVSDYNVYLDCGNAEAYGALYTTDGTFVSEGRKPIVGHDNLVEFSRQRWTKEEVRRRKHWSSNVIIRPTSEGAEAESTHLVVDILPAGFQVSSMHVKLDQLRLENGKWRFYVRKTVPITAE